MLFKKSKKTFIHIDCDSFFASCEVLKNPNLKDKFVCVWSEIVIACTYNCKKLWVKCGTPVWEAKKMLKNKWVFLPCNHSYYEMISDRVFEFIKSKTGPLEMFSIDEAFCDISWICEYYNISLNDFLNNLQQDILKYSWIPVSIWCGETKIKAKIYSKLNKPFWIFIWFNLEKEIELFKKLWLQQIPFIWKQSTKKLDYKSKTIYDFIQLWFWEIKKTLWKSWTDLRLELVWVNAFLVKKSTQIKSISRSRSFNHNLNTDSAFLLSQLNTHFERVFSDITTKNFEIKSVSIMFRTKSFEVLIFEHKFGEFTNLRKEIYDEVLKLFHTHFNDKIIYRSVWIIFSNFRNYLPKQTNIFDLKLRNKEQNYNLTKIIENINQKYNKNKVGFWTSLLWDNFCDVKLGIRK